MDLILRVGNLHLSPNGKSLLYTVNRNVPSNDKRVNELWRVNWDGTEDTALVRDGDFSVSEPRWSPDGRYISFMSARRGEPGVKGAQVWALDVHGGEARQITHVLGDLDTYEWSPDSTRLLLSITETPNSDPSKPHPIVIDRYQFKKDREGYLTSESRPKLLYLFDLKSERLNKLTTDSGVDESEAAWSPEGRRIAFLSNHDADPDRSRNTDVFVVSASPGTPPRKLTSFPGPDEGPLTWSADSKSIGYIQGSEAKYEEYDRGHLAVVDVDSGSPRTLGIALDRSFSNPTFAADGKSIVAIVTDDRTQYPVSVSLSSGSVTRLTRQEGVAKNISGGENTGRCSGQMILLRPKPLRWKTGSFGN